MPLRLLTFALRSHLSPDAARQRIAELLVAERVQFDLTEHGLRSTHTPLGLNFQRLWYTRRNWVGLNPFAHVSQVEVTCLEATPPATEVTVCVDRTRVLYMGSPYLCLYWTAPLMPMPFAIIAVVAATALIWFLVSYVAGSLLRHEVSEALAVRAA